MTQHSTNLEADLLPESLPPEIPHTPGRNSLSLHPLTTPTDLAGNTPPIGYPYFPLTPQAWYQPSTHDQGPSVSSLRVYGQQETPLIASTGKRKWRTAEEKVEELLDLLQGFSPASSLRDGNQEKEVLYSIPQTSSNGYKVSYWRNCRWCEYNSQSVV